MRRFLPLFAALVLCLSVMVAVGQSRSVDDDDCACGVIYDEDRFYTEPGGFSNANTEVVFVQRFDPPRYPWRIDTVCVGFQRTGTDTTISYDVVLFANDGTGTTPGTELASVADTAVISLSGSPGEIHTTDVSDVFPDVPAGRVFIGVRWNPTVENSFNIVGDAGIPSPPPQIPADRWRGLGAW